MNKDPKTIVRDRAMEIALSYEVRFSGRNPILMRQKGVGYDIKSESKQGQRYIEVKGVSENWNTYTWQSLYTTEVKCLQENPDKFYLYIVHFDLKGKERTEKEIKEASYELYIILGKELLNKNEFKIQPDSFSLTPISKRKLEKYKCSAELKRSPSFASSNCKHRWELIKSGKTIYGENNGYFGIISDFRCKKCGIKIREFSDGINFR